MSDHHPNDARGDPQSESRRAVGAVWLWTERFAWAVGLAALLWWAGATGAGIVGAQAELDRFAAHATAVPSSPLPDQRLWSGERVRAWLATLKDESPPPLAVLRIGRLGLEVAVLAGTDEWTLNRAVGHIDDTAPPGGDGNAGIAGHRDGFFRALEGIRAGDLIEIETRGGVDRYRVERTWVVDPADVSVLDPTPTPSVTLVTCYPFYFVGPAPQRFIVRAVRTETVPKPKVSLTGN